MDPRAAKQGMLEEVEALFANTESIVIAAFEVLKLGQSADSTGAALLKALGAKSQQRDVKTRVLAFTVKRSLTDRGFKASMHTCKSADAGSGMELRKTYALKYLHEARVTAPDADGSSGDVPSASPKAAAAAAAAKGGAASATRLVALRVAGHHNIAEHKGEYVFGDEGTLMLMLSLVVQLLRQQDANLPSLSGVTLESLDAWWRSHEATVAARLTPFALEVVTPGATQAGRRDVGASVLVSAKEEAELDELLDMFAMGLGEADEFQDALQDEFAALEAANVYAILGSTPLVDTVILQLKHTSSILEDLDESLKVFDFKLRHMRDDIAVIEASNNALELQARNNQALLSELTRLKQEFEVDPGLAAVLDNTRLDAASLRQVVAAAWTLYSQVSRLDPESPDCIGTELMSLRVAREARQRIDTVVERFVSRVGQHFSNLVASVADDANKEWMRQSERGGRLKLPTRTRARASLSRHRPLLAATHALAPAAFRRLQMQYAQALNGALRRELRGCSSELRRLAQADMASGGDYGLAVRDKSVALSKRSHQRSTSSYGGADDSHSEAGSDAPPSPSQHGAAVSPAAPRSPMVRRGVGQQQRRAAIESGALQALPLHEAFAYLLEVWVPFLLDEALYAADLMRMYRDDDTPRPPRPAKQPATSSASPRQQSSQGTAALSNLHNTLARGRAPSPSQQQQRQQQQQQQQQQQRPDLPSARTTEEDEEQGWQEHQEGYLHRQGGNGEASPSGRGHALSASGAAALDALMSGVDAELQVLVELTAKSHQVHVPPMMLAAAKWLARLADRAPAAALSKAVNAALERLSSQLSAFVAAQVAAIEGYDSRPRIGTANVKSIHILPFVSQFTLLASGMEALLADALGDDDVAVLEQWRQEGGGVAAGGVWGADAEPGAVVVVQIREDVDNMYQQLVSRMFTCIERTAATDAKYADRLCLENYTHLVEGCSPLVAYASSGMAMSALVAQAEAKRESVLMAYVQAQLEYGKLWRALEFGDKLDKLLQVMSPPEVAFQKDCSMADARSLLKSTMAEADKKLEAMLQRVRKHLGTGRLANGVWDRLKTELMQRYERLEDLLERCYPNVPLRPSPEELRELFKTTSS